MQRGWGEGRGWRERGQENGCAWFIRSVSGIFVSEWRGCEEEEGGGSRVGLRVDGLVAGKEG